MSIALLLPTLLAAMVISCDQTGRQEIMTFLFDGVEQPELHKPSDRFVDANSLIPTQDYQGPVWYVHEPCKDCTNCHDKARQSRYVGRAYLPIPVPQLCFDCHDDPAVSKQFVHGPVAVGQCLQCHHHHKSRIEHLLHGPMPELCYGCHDINAIEALPAHFVTELSACTDCHDPHAGVERFLLKEDARRLGAERALGRQVGGVQTPESQGPMREQNPLARPNMTDPELRKSKQEIADIFYTSMRLYRNGRLIPAREGLVTVLSSGLIPPEMGATIRGYIADIDKRLAERTR